MTIKDILGKDILDKDPLHFFNIHGYILYYDPQLVEDFSKKAKKFNIKIFIQHFKTSNLKLQNSSPIFKIYESIDILGVTRFGIEYNKGPEYFKIFDYKTKLASTKKISRKKIITNFKNLELKRVKRLSLLFINNFLKLKEKQ